MSRPIIPSGPIPARVMLIGEAPGADEERLGTPFVGVSGNELTKMLSEAGINRNECFITNLIRIRPPNNDLGAFIAFKKKDVTADHRLLRDKMVRQCVIEGYELLKKEIAACKPHLIIAVGNCAMWALTGKWGVTDWRGSVLATDIIPDGPKCLVTYHPAAVLRQWSLRGIVVQDFRRAKREADFPELLAPPYRFIVRPNLETALGVINALSNYADELCSPNTEVKHAPTHQPSPPLANRTPWRLLALDGKLNLSHSSEAPGVSWLSPPNPRSSLAVDVAQQSTPSPRASSPADLPTNALHKPDALSSPAIIPFKLSSLKGPESNVSGNLPPPDAGGKVESDCQGEKGQLLRSLPPSLRDQKSLTLSVDIETRQGHIACIGIAWSDNEAICIPLMCVEDSDGYWSLEEEALLLHKLYKLLTHPRVDVIGQNFIYDAQYIHRHWHFIPRFKRDTMLAQHVCFPSGGKIEPDGRITPSTSGMPKSLDFLASMYCEQYRFWKNDGKEWRDTSEDTLWSYNCEDCVRTYEVDVVLQRTVDQLNLREPHDFQQSLFYPVLRTMIRGMRANTDLQAKMVFELQDAAVERQTWLDAVIGHPLNIKSPKQVADFFYREMGQQPYHNRKSGGETTDDETLEKIALREPLLKPIVNKILELRSIGVYTGTFLKSMLDYDGRLRCSFNIAGTVTFRFSSSENAFGSGCLPGRAEVLTEFGWVRLDRFQSGTRAMAWDMANEILRFESADLHIEIGDSHQMLVCDGEQVHQIVTFGHRMPFKLRKAASYSVAPAAVVSQYSDIRLPVASKFLGGKGYEPEYPRLYVSALADGSFEGNGVRWGFKKKRKIERFLELCELYEVTPSEQKARDGYRRFYIPKPTTWDSIKEWGLWVLYTPFETLYSMVDEARYWDATSRGESFIFFSKDNHQIGWFSTAAHLTGFSCGKPRKGIATEDSYSPGCICWAVNVKPRDWVHVIPKMWSTEQYKDNVYCLTIPSTHFMVRLDDYIFITGNTNMQNWSKGDE